MDLTGICLQGRGVSKMNQLDCAGRKDGLVCRSPK